MLIALTFISVVENPQKKKQNLRPADVGQGGHFNAFFKDMQQRVSAFQAEILDVKVTFIRPSDDSPFPYFKEGPIYGGPYQQMEAFLFFSKAVMEYLKWSNKQPNILHIHDWHTCAVPLLYWDMYYQKGGCGCVCERE